MTFKGKILVVDDESHIRKFVTLMVASLGSPVVLEAANGTEALQVYEREKPDLVLLDVNMPRIDGLETLRSLKRVNPACNVIMLTSLVNRHTVEECLELGAFAYVRKDNPPDEMMAQLKTLVASCFNEAPQP